MIDKPHYLAPVFEKILKTIYDMYTTQQMLQKMVPGMGTATNAAADGATMVPTIGTYATDAAEDGATMVPKWKAKSATNAAVTEAGTACRTPLTGTHDSINRSSGVLALMWFRIYHCCKQWSKWWR